MATISNYLSAKNMVSGTVSWSIDGNGNLKVRPTSGTTGYRQSFTSGSAPWADCSSNIKTFSVEQGTTVGVETKGSLASMFNNCRYLSSVDFTGFSFANCVNMSNMFNSCFKLASVNLNGVNTSNVTNMANMFNNCIALNEIDLTSLRRCTRHRHVWHVRQLCEANEDYLSAQVQHFIGHYHGADVRKLHISAVP